MAHFLAGRAFMKKSQSGGDSGGASEKATQHHASAMGLAPLCVAYTSVAYAALHLRFNIADRVECKVNYLHYISKSFLLYN